jgi:Alternative complex III, ActD subunit
MKTAQQGLMASFDYLDSTVEAIEALRKDGFEEITAFSPFPEEEIEHALGYGPSPVRLFTLVGGLTGAATGFALTIFTATDWPLVTGGKPIVSVPPYVVIAFELTILFGVLSTVIGVLWNMRVPNLKTNIVYDREFTAGRFGVYVTAPDDRLSAARAILEANGPSLLQEDPEGRAHG